MHVKWLMNPQQIWETADEKNLGYLTPDTFAIALKLIACAQNKIQAKEPLFSTGKRDKVIRIGFLLNFSPSSDTIAQHTRRPGDPFIQQQPKLDYICYCCHCTTGKEKVSGHLQQPAANAKRHSR